MRFSTTLVCRRAAIPLVGWGLALGLLTGCSTVNMGVSVPVGRGAGVGVSVGSDGRVGVGVGVSVGAGTVSVGTSGQLPVNKDEDTASQK